ncbi:MAG: prepilin peptidase [Opitutaceae bacterium]|jgi:leader peptidase (prepilin peptidase)/N-methyltransferase
MIDALVDINAQARWFFPSAVFMFGAIVGSFLNVCILRIPAGKSIVRPGSHCGCGAPIAWHDNIPILSWILLKGRARCCGRRFSVRYPAIELFTALLFTACWLLFPPLKALCGMILLSFLICATFIDLDHMIIPDSFTIGLGIVGVILSFAIPMLHGMDSGLFILDSVKAGVSSIVGMLIGSGLVLWIALVAEAILKKEAMGFGDVKFVGAIGAFTGWQGTVTAVFGGAIIGSLWFTLAIVWRKLTSGRKPSLLKAETPEGRPADLGFGVQVPYGPMLAIAGAAHFLWVHKWVQAYFDQLVILFK